MCMFDLIGVCTPQLVYRVSIAKALTGMMTNDPPSLGGFLAMTDSIVSLILNSSSKSQNMIKVNSDLIVYY